MLNHWPSREELIKAKVAEDTRAVEQGDEPDPICACGELAFCCICEELARELGYWSDGTEYQFI